MMLLRFGDEFDARRRGLADFSNLVCESKVLLCLFFGVFSRSDERKNSSSAIGLQIVKTCLNDI